MQQFSIASGEGQKRLNIITDANFEAMSNTDKFCFGDGAFSTERPRKITYWLLEVVYLGVNKIEDSIIHIILKVVYRMFKISVC